jgi:hypothetical protein
VKFKARVEWLYRTEELQESEDSVEEANILVMYKITDEGDEVEVTPCKIVNVVLRHIKDTFQTTFEPHLKDTFQDILYSLKPTTKICV